MSQSKPSSELSRAVDTEGVVIQTHIGGQALLEGIMMRGRYSWALAVRRSNGTIHTEEHELASGRPKNAWMAWPVIRGCTALVESLTLGYQSLQVAAEAAFSEVEPDQAEDVSLPATSLPATPDPASPALEADSAEVSAGQTAATDTPSIPTEQPTPPPASAPAKKPTKQDDAALPAPLLTLTMLLGVLLSMLIFVALPAFLTNLLVGEYGARTLVWNLVDGVLRIAIFISYIALIGRMQEIRRMFGYHGAEHRTIHCYEHGLELTAANASRFSSLHVRCGTAFMLTTMLIAILVFTIVPISTLIAALGVTGGPLYFVLLVLLRIVLIPLIAGLSYEVTVKWAGSRPENRLVRLVLWPGMQLQRLTTNTPDNGQLECAIAAMQLVLAREARESASPSA